MGWEIRGNTEYYYEGKRVGGRVVKRYVGPGKVAKLVESYNRLKRKERTDERNKARAFVDDLGRLERLLEPLNLWANTVAEAALLAAGYHRTKRGPWRKRRVQAVERTPDDPDPTRTGCDT